MKTLRLYVGHGFKADEFVERSLANGTIGGATILDAIGHWTSTTTGELISEPARVIVLVAIDTFDAKHIFKMADLWRRTQTEEESIMVEYDGKVGFDRVP